MEIKKDIENRKDVHLLVSQFYALIRQDEQLGPIFNKHIQDWEEHIEKLTTFWENQLWFSKGYKGNPLEIHHEVDASMEYGITQEHFGHWLQLWYASIEGLFDGEMAKKAKSRARNMSTMFFIYMYQHRPMKKG